MAPARRVLARYRRALIRPWELRHSVLPPPLRSSCTPPALAWDRPMTLPPPPTGAWIGTTTARILGGQATSTTADSRPTDRGLTSPVADNSALERRVWTTTTKQEPS